MITLGEIALPDDMIWRDELSAITVTRSQATTLTGALVVDEDVAQHRPITLFGTVTRAQLKALRLLEASTNTIQTLTLNDGIPRSVVFAPSAIENTPYFEISDPRDSDFHELTLRLTEIL